MLGVDEHRQEDRDYRHLLAGLRVPAHVFLGQEPLGEPRAFTEMPSLVDAQDRAALAAHPLVTLTVAPGGHHVARRNVDALFAALQTACAEGWGRERGA